MTDLNVAPENTPFKLSNPVHFLALGFGSGLIKPAPGTWGTLAAVPVYLLIAMITGHWLVYAGIVIIAFLVGIYLCGKTADDVGVHDHGAIVWDEFVGLWITLFMVPLNFTTLLLGFVLFRFFDILKPLGIRYLDKNIKGGTGVMLDDVLAGIYACGCLHLIIRFVPSF